MTPARPEPGERLVVEQRVHRRATLDDHWRPVPERTDVFRAVLTVRFAYRNGRIVGRLPDGRDVLGVDHQHRASLTSIDEGRRRVNAEGGG